MDQPPAFELDSVEVRFGRLRALAGVDLRVRQAEQLALIGPSGAGKTTLLATVNGGVAPAAGRIEVLGRDMAVLSPRGLREVRRRIGAIHQGLDLVGPMRVVHNVNAGRLGTWSFWRSAASLVVPQETEDVARVLGRLGIAHKLHERTDRLSGGEQQRVAIARLIVQGPAIILADEPISNLDPARQGEIMDLLTEQARLAGAALLASLHDVEVALGRFPRVVGLRDGRIAFDLRSEDVTDEMVEDLYAVEESAGLP